MIKLTGGYTQLNVTDTYTAADTTPLPGRAPSTTSQPSQVYRNDVGTFYIMSNKATGLADANGDCFSLPGIVDGTINYSIAGALTSSNGRIPCILICGINKNNFIIIWPRDNLLRMTAMINGGLANLPGYSSVSIPATVDGTEYPVKIERNGNNFRVYWNGAVTPTIDYTFTSFWRKFANYNRVGGYIVKSGVPLTTATWDNLILAGPIVGQRLPLLVFDGDSLTIGANLTEDASYPYQVMTGISTSPTLGYTWVNEGINGQTVSTMTTNAPGKIDIIYDSTRFQNICILWGGTNDLSGGASATTTYNRIVTYAQARKAAGFKVIVLTITPRTDAGLIAGFETARLAVNTSILADNTNFDAKADVGGDAIIGQVANTTNTTYFQNDQLHLTQAGMAIVAGLVKTAIGTI